MLFIQIEVCYSNLSNLNLFWYAASIINYLPHVICSWWILLPKLMWELMHTWRWAIPYFSTTHVKYFINCFSESEPVTLLLHFFNICICSSAGEDIRRTVWYPCRCLECGNLFHGGLLFICLYICLLFGNSMVRFLTTHLRNSTYVYCTSVYLCH